PHAVVLARSSSGAEALARTWTACEKPYANVGHSLLRLVGAVAGALGDQARRASALVSAVEKEPDDDDVVAEADEAIASSTDEALSARFSKKVGDHRRSEALRKVASRAVERGDAPMSVRYFERAFEFARGSAKEDISRQLQDALMKAGRPEEAVL